MSSLNKIKRTYGATGVFRTHEGGPAVRNNAETELRRAVLATLLWEDGFYENGVSIAERIKALVKQVPRHTVLALAREARDSYQLRHIPLYLVLCALRARYVAISDLGNTKDIGDTLAHVIQRPDEIAEFLSMYWKDGKVPLAKQVKRGLRTAFRKFDAYQLAKWNRTDKEVTLRDSLFLVHAKPPKEWFSRMDSVREERALSKPGYKRGKVWRHDGSLFDLLVQDKLPAPDTWEVALSAGADKGTTFARLIRENRLPYMALLKNLRNMEEARVDRGLVADAIVRGAATSRALPYRYITAAKVAPAYEAALDEAMQVAMESMDKLPGRTCLLVDVSGSMDWGISGGHYGQRLQPHETTRIDVASGLAIMVRGVCPDVDVYTFSRKLVQVPARRGMALRDAIKNSQEHRDTFLGDALRTVAKLNQKYDRTIVITDEQTRDQIPQPIGKGYMVNVANARNGIAYGPWTSVTGWSEGVVKFIIENEKRGF